MRTSCSNINASILNSFRINNQLPIFFFPPPPAGQRALGGSAPVNIPGSLARSSSFNSSSSLSTSPLSSLSQSLSQSLLSAAVAQQNQQPSVLAKQELGLRGTPTSSSQNSLGELLLLFHWSPAVALPHLTRFVPFPGLNGGAGSIWDFVSGSFSPSPSPVFSSLSSAASSGDLSRLFRDLDEAKKKLKQWEEAWLQVKQVSAAESFSQTHPRFVPDRRTVLLAGV